MRAGGAAPFKLLSSLELLLLFLTPLLFFRCLAQGHGRSAVAFAVQLEVPLDVCCAAHARSLWRNHRETAQSMDSAAVKWEGMVSA